MEPSITEEQITEMTGKLSKSKQGRDKAMMFDKGMKEENQLGVYIF